MAWAKSAQRETDEELSRELEATKRQLRMIRNEVKDWRDIARWLGKRMRRLERQLDKEGEG